MLSYTQLQRGYEALRSRVHARKEALQKDLKDGKGISETDEAWLDTDANLVNKEITLDRLNGVKNLTDAIELLPEHLQKTAKLLILGASYSVH